MAGGEFVGRWTLCIFSFSFGVIIAN
jgi:hypothetical protein